MTKIDDGGPAMTESLAQLLPGDEIEVTEIDPVPSGPNKVTGSITWRE